MNRVGSFIILNKKVNLHLPFFNSLTYKLSFIKLLPN